MAKGTIGTRIQQVRENRRMTASDLARLAGVTPTAVWNWETNGTRPRPNALSSAAKALGVTIDFLISGDEKATGLPNGATVNAGGIDSILRSAQVQIAQLHGIDPDRVKVSFRVE
jgi:transcriptional regulator with XRE-family HTH domain